MTTLITSSADLIDVCTLSSSEPFIAIDTEFMRDKTYYPRLCLVQIATRDHDFLIDPLSDGMDLSPFFALMSAPTVTKVFHAARQDIEILWKQGRVIPQPLFDTQIAAMMCGYGASISYEQLVGKCLNTPINKSLRFTDWALRPLSEEHKAYAAADVRHLHALYSVMRDELKARGRETWFEDQQRVLLSWKTYENVPEEAWMRLRTRVKTPRAFALLVEVAAWRERLAQRQDVPRQHILKDDQMIALISAAEQGPMDLTDFIRFMRRPVEETDLSALQEAVHNGSTRDVNLLPETDLQERHRPSTTPTLEMLKLLLKAVAEEENIPAYTLGSTEDLFAFLKAEDVSQTHLFSGWRAHVLGEKAQALKSGEGALMIKNGRVTFMPCSPAGRIRGVEDAS